MPETTTCPHCHAYNGRSRCGCAAARAERGEPALTYPGVDELDAIVLPGFDADGRRLAPRRRGRGLR